MILATISIFSNELRSIVIKVKRKWKSEIPHWCALRRRSTQKQLESILQSSKNKNQKTIYMDQFAFECFIHIDLNKKSVKSVKLLIKVAEAAKSYDESCVCIV